MEGLQHRLAVLLLVLDEQVDEVARAQESIRAARREVELGEESVQAVVDPGEVVARRGHIEQLQGAALGTGRHARVVGLSQLGAQHRAAGHRGDPEVGERGDVGEIPDDRAQQRGVHALEIGHGDVLDRRERALPGANQPVDVLGRVARRGGRRGRHVAREPSGFLARGISHFGERLVGRWHPEFREVFSGNARVVHRAERPRTGASAPSPGDPMGLRTGATPTGGRFPRCRVARLASLAHQE